MENNKQQWDMSYSNKDNFLFYPHEEVIRFFSKYIRKRIGFNDFKDVVSFTEKPCVLDLGCGIGRHVMYAASMGLDAYGIDLSEKAVKTAIDWAVREGIADPQEKIKQGDVSKLPWKDGYFDFVVSHAVLDSMHYDLAKKAVAEVGRVLKKGGLFYCDLISGDDYKHAREFSGEEVVNDVHERGTIQSYFNYSKISDLFAGCLDVQEALLIKRENVNSGVNTSRHHLVLKK